ncbi:hypothetical protein [Pantoea sp. 18069]|uniref:hypothetical protein n=1 Tax=Pantoea sp. 18069 TaxID=2681415 RepID=UPI00135875E2|nr:hypothetical protein [Pantoea sp. 18069]
MNHDTDIPMFARSRHGTAASTAMELRGQCPSHIVAALDALAMARGLDRNAYVNSVLSAHVQEEVDRASVLVRTLRGNPLLSDGVGGTSE